MKTKKEKRYLRFDDLFELMCKKCKSNDVDIHCNDCSECGTTIDAECNSCGSKYDYHDFKQIEVEYDEKGNELKQK